MKVILLQKVPGLGNPDEVKEVAEGYARNFLFPKHWAVAASNQAVAEVTARHKRLAKEAERDLHEQERLAEKIDGYEVEMVEKANKENVLYAAVTSTKVAEALLKLGFSVDPDQIKMKPIKAVGTYNIPLKFRHGLEAEITLIINQT